MILPGLIAVLWLGVVNQLRVEWAINPQYSYGLGVPFLAAYLLAKRWGTRPPPAAPIAGVTFWLLLGGAAFVLLPVRLVQEANPDWRLVSWAHALTVGALSLFVTWLLGGWPWVRHFIFPIAFLAVAVPWPSNAETAVVQTMMNQVTGLTVETMNWLGVLARQRGNLIELPTGVVGVNEACSGVRSFQSTLMIALFLGELYRLTLARRAVLLGAGVVLAFMLNVARALFLTWQCAKHGMAAAGSWHDPAGYAIFGVSFAGLLGLVFLLRRTNGAEPEDTPPKVASPRTAPRACVAALAAWIVTVEAGTEFWYRQHERAAVRQPGWTMNWPQDPARFRFTALPEEVRTTLRYSVGESAVWRASDTTDWQLFFFRWEPGRAAAQLARNHSPDICLQASGLRMQQDLGVTEVSVGALKVPFHAFVFESRNGQPLHVFYCVWEDRVQQATAGPEDYTPASRLRAVREGRRHLGQQVLEVALRGHPSATEARAALQAGLGRLIRPEGGGL
ncbi:MAG: exosortase/archaeosortase family protein [Verrucomicrobia bacterium]|nr:exosortase/archaeosortase family protein [Verrucomicrobiota bacterium]